MQPQTRAATGTAFYIGRLDRSARRPAAAARLRARARAVGGGAGRADLVADRRSSGSNADRGPMAHLGQWQHGSRPIRSPLHQRLHGSPASPPAPFATFRHRASSAPPRRSPPRLRKEIMPAGIPISDARRLLNYMQFDADGRFMIGARGSFGLHEPESYFDGLRTTAERIFPALRGVDLGRRLGRPLRPDRRSSSARPQSRARPVRGARAATGAASRCTRSWDDWSPISRPVRSPQTNVRYQSRQSLPFLFTHSGVSRSRPQHSGIERWIDWGVKDRNSNRRLFCTDRQSLLNPSWVGCKELADIFRTWRLRVTRTTWMSAISAKQLWPPHQAAPKPGEEVFPSSIRSTPPDPLLSTSPSTCISALAACSERSHRQCEDVRHPRPGRPRPRSSVQATRWGPTATMTARPRICSRAAFHGASLKVSSRLMTAAPRLEC